MRPKRHVTAWWLHDNSRYSKDNKTWLWQMKVNWRCFVCLLAEPVVWMQFTAKQNVPLIFSSTHSECYSESFRDVIKCFSLFNIALFVTDTQTWMCENGVSVKERQTWFGWPMGAKPQTRDNILENRKYENMKIRSIQIFGDAVLYLNVREFGFTNIS